jgi:hypothetical protein
MDFLTKCKYHNYRKNNPQFNVPLGYNSEFELNPPPQTVFRRQYSLPSSLLQYSQPSSLPSSTVPLSYSPPQLYSSSSSPHTPSSSTTNPFQSSHWPMSSQILHRTQRVPVASKQSMWESIYKSSMDNSLEQNKKIRFASQSSVMLIPNRHEYDNKSELWWTSSEIKTMFIQKQLYPGGEAE